MSKIKPSNVDEYIEAAPLVAREKLREIRSILAASVISTALSAREKHIDICR